MSLLEFNDRIYATRYALAFAEAEIRINEYWEEKQCLRKFEYKRGMPDRWLEICYEFDYRAKFGYWRWEVEKYEKECNTVTPKIVARKGLLFTQFCECGAIFQGENGDIVANQWRIHQGLDHGELQSQDVGKPNFNPYV